MESKKLSGKQEIVADVVVVGYGCAGAVAAFTLLALPLGLAETNSDLLSPGRQRLAEEMLNDLNAGLIDTGVDPAVWQGQ